MKPLNCCPILITINFIIALTLISQTRSAPSISKTIHELEDTIDKFEEQKQIIRLLVTKELDKFRVKMERDDGTLLQYLSLRPGGSFFSNNFTFKNLDVDSEGKTVFTEEKPTADILKDISNKIYIDPDLNAVLKVDKRSSGEYCLEGLLDEDRISCDGDNKISHSLYSTSSKKKKRGTSKSDIDVVDAHRPIIAGRAVPGTSVSAAPELAFLLDYENSKQFNWEKSKILDYASVFVNAMNNRFSTMTDPQITFSLAGIYTTKTLALQNHFEKAKLQGHYDSNKLLDSFTHWAFENKASLGKYDLLAVLTTVPLEGRTAGIAYVQSACWNQKSSTEKRDMSVFVNRDIGGLWTGSQNIVHEVAHCLGANHDGEDNSASCPWEDGYMMSYEGWGLPNKYKFSSCSQESMRQFIVSSGGSCLNTNSVPKNLLTTSDSLGKRVTMEELCKKVTEKADATVHDDDADSLCRVLKCKYSSGKGMFTIESLPTMIGNDAACGKGGKCKDGYCIGNQHKPIVSQAEKDKVCEEKLGKKNVTSIDASDFPPDRQCNSLKCYWSAPDGSYSWVQVSIFLGNGIPCGKTGGKCEGGKCKQ